MTRSVSSWWAPNAPVWRRSASTRVVLPWSTCATMATFLMSSRVSMGGPHIEDLGALSFRRPIRGTFRPRPRQFHRLRPEGEDRWFGLDPDQDGPSPATTRPPCRARRPHAGAAPRPGSPGQLARTEPRGGPTAHEVCIGQRTSARPRSASNAEGGCPTSGLGRRPVARGAVTSPGPPQPGRPGHCFRADGGTSGRRETVNRAVQLGGGALPSRTQREDRPPVPHRSRGERAERASIRRTAATRMDRRAVGRSRRTAALDRDRGPRRWWKRCAPVICDVEANTPARRTARPASSPLPLRGRSATRRRQPRGTAPPASP